MFELKVGLEVMQAFMGKPFERMQDHVDFWAAAGYDYIRVRASYDFFKNTIEMDHIGAMWMTDDIAYAGGLMVSPRLYHKYLFPWYKKMGDLCKEHNMPYLFHSDGQLSRHGRDSPRIRELSSSALIVPSSVRCQVVNILCLEASKMT